MSEGQMHDDTQERETTDNGAPPPEITTPTAIAAPGEKAIAQVAETARRLVEAKYLMAERHPRDEDQARLRILKDCERPGFARSARYRKPIGKGIEGLSIRFVEAALRHWKNVYSHTPVLYEDDELRISRIELIDLESNVSYSFDVTIAKTVERSRLQEDQVPIATRRNASGNMVYIVRATEDEMLGKMLSFASKIIRNNGLRMLPVDLKEDAERTILETIRNRATKDPDGMKKELLQDFYAVGVEPKDLREAGFDTNRLSPADLNLLAEIITELEEGRTSWSQFLEARKGAAPESPASKAKAAAKQAAQGGKGSEPQQETLS